MMERPVLSLIEETLVVIVVKLLELDMHVEELIMVLENQLLSASLLICLGKRDCVERILSAQYENEGWNDTFTSEEVSFSYENPNVEQLLRIMERKVDTLMKDATPLMGSSEVIFRLTTNEICQPPTEPSRQEEFEHIVMKFIYDQEERIKQLKNYMQDIIDEFMEFSSEVTLRLKERIKENESKPRKIKKITKYPDTKAMSKRARSTRGHASSSHNETMEEKFYKFGLFDNEDHQMNYNTLAGCSIHSEDVMDWEFLSNKGLAQYDPLHKGVKFRLGGMEKEMHLLEFGCRVGLYSERGS
ncbi:hypothetical protein Tco_0656680 [Tanacetum coccineum]|uniref:Uncharacterized protein n=1 Tax=Tanacetum coccineum TaxID=301880 RepID=A0ABQ4X9N1_9ASTR